jgi:serine/threonine protein kinase
MGEVYRARDTRLSREVAVKVLAAELAADETRLKRFEKEARAASAFNHPNIVTIFDIGSTDGVSWIAMERVEGQTLRKLMTGGGLSMRRLLAIATQIADGLTKAHEAGIVHRDLKPENVMVTRDGVVKILDFGLAKLTLFEPKGGETSQVPTETRTSPGMLVGTVSYMSPEQAAGEEIDFRSDQFAFGSILYEMATGRRAFSKKTSVDTLSAILNEEPEPIGSLNPQITPPLRWIVERCLAKDPDGRYASTRDLARDLATVRDHSSEVSSGALIPSARRKTWPLVAAAVACLTVLAAGAVLILPRLRAPVPPNYHQLTFRRGLIHPARFTPDGHTVLYSASFEGGPWRVYSSRPESPESSALPWPDAMLASVSRSGELAILRDTTAPKSTLARVPLAGGAPRDILESVSAADWSPDGANLAVAHEVEGKIRLEFPIGKPLYESNGYIHCVRVSPKGDLVALSDMSQAGDSIGSVVVVDHAGKSRTLSTGWSDLGKLAWVPDESEIWFTASRGGARHSLWAVSLRGKERLVETTPGSVELQDISRTGSVLLTQYSNRRSIIGLAPGDKTERNFSWLDYSEPVELSADGKVLLFEEWGEGGGPSGSIYLRRLDDPAPVRLGSGLALSLSPDGRTLLARMYTNPPRIVLIPTGPGEPRVIPGENLHYEQCGRFLPDGKRILYAAREPKRGVRLYLQDIDGGKPVAMTPEGTPAPIQQCACVSPDGRLVAAFDSEYRLVLFPTKEGTPRPAQGVEPGENPLRFSADGRFLFVAQGPKVFRVDPESGRRELWKEFAPPDPAGVLPNGWFIVLSGDGKSYFYSFQAHLSELYLVDGMR